MQLLTYWSLLINTATRVIPRTSQHLKPSLRDQEREPRYAGKYQGKIRNAFQATVDVSPVSPPVEPFMNLHLPVFPHKPRAVACPHHEPPDTLNVSIQLKS